MRIPLKAAENAFQQPKSVLMGLEYSRRINGLNAISPACENSGIFRALQGNSEELQGNSSGISVRHAFDAKNLLELRAHRQIEGLSGR